MVVTRVIIIHFVIIVWSLLVNFNVVCQEVQLNKTVVLSTSKSTTTSTTTTTTTVKPAEAPVQKINVTEGGAITLSAPLNDTTHQGREHMIKVDIKHKHTPKNDSKSVEAPQFEVPEKNDDKKSVPRKGVDFIDTSQNATQLKKTTTTAKPKKKKPTITEATDDDTLPSDSDAKTKSNDTNNHGNQVLVSIESVTEKHKKTDYIVPIVVVILSVPLVAILFSVVYKRGAEWWQHRHYRRMDFLIEGMYNN